ncbi:MAG TPA: hypothetical protein PK760_10005, partial [Flavobacteriales bacterium]|nr:hypothetical protein [Flavobacteriales bacterium]
AGLSINAASGVVNTAASIAGTYTVTYTIAASGGCAQFQTTASITITAAPVAAISYTGSPFCTSLASVAVNNTSNQSGTFTSSPAGLSLTATGTIKPALSSGGNYTVTYTIAASGGCAQVSASTTVVITTMPSATINYANSPYCKSANTASVTRVGKGGGNYTSSPALPGLSSSSGSIDLAVAPAGTYTITYTIAADDGCAQFQTTAQVTITALPTAAITYTGSPLCSTPTSAPVSLTSTAVGTFSSNPVGLVINATSGTINPSSSIAGGYTVTYHIPAANGCQDVNATAAVSITTAPNATMSYPGSPYCSNAGSATPTITGTSGGAFTSTAGLSINASSGVVNTAASTAGTYTVNYTVPANAGCAQFSTTASITINAAPSAGLSGATTTCSNSPGFNLASLLTGSPAPGGSWSYGGVAHGSTFTPGIDLAGNYTYTVVGAAPCANASAVVAVSVTPAQVWYADVDGDGFGDPLTNLLSCTQPIGYVANATDMCPTDASKQVPGTFGCGVPDTDTDSDGTANCIDACPLDPLKIAPGLCGCGVVEGSCLDCLGVPFGSATIGSACNDGNPCTINDTWSAACGCA